MGLHTLCKFVFVSLVLYLAWPVLNCTIQLVQLYFQNSTKSALLGIDILHILLFSYTGIRIEGIVPKATAPKVNPLVAGGFRTPIAVLGGVINGSCNSQKNHKFHAYTVDLRPSCRLALGGQTVKSLRRLVYEFELNQSQCKWVARRNAS